MPANSNTTYEEDVLRLPPQAIEAEQSILGSMMLDNRVIDEISSELEPRDFYRSDHQVIYKEIITLDEGGQAADVVTVSEALTTLGEIEKVGGLAYLGALAKNTPNASNVKSYAKIVRERAILRRLIESANDIIQAAYQPDGKEPAEVLDFAEQMIFEIAKNNNQAKAGFRKIDSLLSEAVDKIEELFKTKQTITGVSTGFIDLDKKTTGLQGGDLVIVAGRPSMGKTSFAMNLVEEAAISQNLPVAVFSMEMPGAQLATRMLASLSRVNSNKLRTGQLDNDDWPKLTSALGLLQDKHIYIDDTPALSPLEVRTRARRLAAEHEHGLGLIMIDYLQLMRGSDSSENRTLEISNITRSLKGLAKELDCPVVVLSQLNRSLEQRPDKRPIMSDLRECVVGDTQVYMANSGEYQRVDQLVGKKGFKVLALDEGFKLVERECLDVWPTGEKQIYKVTTESGNTICVSDNHPFMTVHGWKPLKDLKVGNFLATPTTINFTGSSDLNDDAFIEFTRMLSGDYLHKDESSQQEIPSQVFQGNQQQVAFFIKHLWSGNVVADFGGGVSNAKHQLYYNSDSRKLVSGLKSLLLRFSISSSIRVNLNAGKQVSYQLAITSNTNILKFADLIGLLGSASNELDELVALIQAQLIQDQNKVPETVEQPLSLDMTELRKVAGMADSQASEAYLPQTELPQTANKKGAMVMQSDALANLADNDVTWDKIVTIEPQGMQMTYDLHIKDDHNFVANDFIIHNSGAIEQDADLIMFIYRHEVYEPDTEHKGSAEIIVAKQRNGPIGKVRLTFLGEFTRFENAATPNFSGDMH